MIKVMRSKKLKQMVSVAILFVIAVGGYQYVQDQEPVVDEILLENIEALANSETGNYMCAYPGDLDCHGRKVKYKYEDFSLN